jgi:hypothetical protein
MSDEVEFQLLTRSLTDEDLGRRVVTIDRLRRALLIGAICLGLLVAAMVMALTNTASLMITLAVVALIGVEVARLGLREYRRETQ